MKKALITGITGQDGSYLAELLLQKGYEVHGIIRRSSSINTGRLNHLYVDPHKLNEKCAVTTDCEPSCKEGKCSENLFLHYGDLTEPYGISHILQKVQPEEVYNLAAQSHVKVSFEMPTYTSQIVAIGVLNLLEAIRIVNPKIRFYQASSSEMFGNATKLFGDQPGQDETVPFNPQSPYAASKVFGHMVTQNYRRAYNMHASCGILFNHESPRRGETFVTRKVTMAVARIYLGLEKHVYLGNLAAQRDWGHARDYVEAMWMMLQQEQPGDYVIATGEAHTVLEFVEKAFQVVGLDYRDHVIVDPRYFRPSEVDYLRGVATQAKEKLGWTPKVTFDELVHEMVQYDIDATP